MKKIWSLIAVALALGGCAAPPMIPAPAVAEKIIVEFESVPPMQAVTTVEVGENMYREYSVKTSQTSKVRTLDDAAAKMDVASDLKIPKGTVGLLSKTYQSNYRAMCVDWGANSIVAGASHVCLVDKDVDGVFESAMFKVRLKYFPLTQPVRYEILPAESTTKIEVPEFKYVVLYQGVSKGSMKVSFREFIKDMARPAFTQDISYDLEADGTTVIAFKGLRIKVEKATSSSVTYSVVKPFGLTPAR